MKMSCCFQPGFNYTITVPDLNGDYSKNKDDCNFDFIFDEKRKPLIILFGWAGSSDRHLSTYSRIYEAKGFATIRFVVSPTSMFLWKQHIHFISTKMVRIVEEFNPSGQPIFVHCFSNGGSYLYQHFVEAVKLGSKPIVIKGIIFDSAPCRRTIGSSYRAIRVTFPQGKFLSLPYSVFLLLVYMSLWICEFVEMFVLRRTAIQFKPMECLLKEENKCPQHFIYSKADKVISWKEVELFIAARKAIGVDVSVMIYEDTEHVRHYPPKKYTYTQSIFNFISKCHDLESSVV